MSERLDASVVIPAYRAARTIGRAVDSVLAQTRPPREIIVVDDGSPDDLAAALQGYGDRVTLVRKPNGGAASARNLGIDRSTGDLIAFLDADDYWEPDKLRRQCEVFERHPEVGLVASRFYTQEPGAPRKEKAWPGELPYNQVLRPVGREAFEMGTKVWTSALMIRRSTLGANRFESGLEPAEDRDLWARVVKAAPMYYLSDRLATAVLEPGSLSRSSAERDCTNMVRVVNRHAALLGRSGVRKWEAITYAKCAGTHLSEGRPVLALRAGVSRIVREPASARGWWLLIKSTGCAAAGWCRMLWGRVRKPSGGGLAAA